MTSIFRVKGEEFDYIILPGCTEGNLPCKRFTENPTFDTAGIVTVPPPSGDLDNERRLFYVAITRAKKSVLISTSVSPMLGQQGASHIMPGSRFLEELQHDATKEVMHELQRCACTRFNDLTSLSAVAMKHAANEQIVYSLLDGYLARNNLALAEDIQKRIRATPKIPFQYKHQYDSDGITSQAKQRQPLLLTEPDPWDE